MRILKIAAVVLVVLATIALMLVGSYYELHYAHRAGAKIGK